MTSTAKVAQFLTPSAFELNLKDYLFTALSCCVIFV